MSRSPTRTTRPPSRLGSTATSSSTRPPVNCSSLVVRASSSAGVSSAAEVALARVMPWRWLSSRRNSAATRGSCSIRRRCNMSRIRLSTGRLTAFESAFSTSASRSSRATAGLDSMRATRSSPSAAAAPSSSERQASTVPSRRATSKAASAYRRAAVSRPAISAPSVLRSVHGGPAQELVDQPPLAGVGHRLADDLAGREEGQVGDFGPHVGDRTDLLGLDVGGGPDAHPLELLPGRGDVRIACLLGDLLGTGQDVIRLAARLAEGGHALGLRVLAIAAGLLGVLESLFDPRLPVGEHRRDRLERERPDDHEEQDEVERAD